MICRGINCSVHKLRYKFCFVEEEAKSNLDFELRRDVDMCLRVECDEGILRRYIEIRQGLDADE